jgi:GTP-binding protein LepA
MLCGMEGMKNIRNFVIIAHIDSGKSTLADRLLEITGTVEARSMKPQYLDRLPLERERGITIKMAPVRMAYKAHGVDYVLNLIDTPGHSDFSYEVSRALAAVEGAILLIDGTRGIQAQTLSNLRSAQKAGLTIIPAVNKIDLVLPQAEKIVESVAELLGVPKETVFRISAKTGAGVKELLEAVVAQVPPPRAGVQVGHLENSVHAEHAGHPAHNHAAKALIFDSLYDDHKGIIAFVRVFDGEFKTEDMKLLASGAVFKPKEVGYFSPDLKVSPKILNGEIGYIATGLKEPSLVSIGDTVVRVAPGGAGAGASGAATKADALPGYREPGPVVFISFYPDGDTKFDDLKRAFEKLRLNDAALSFEPDANEALGRGLKVGFLGQLHF